MVKKNARDMFPAHNLHPAQHSHVMGIFVRSGTKHAAALANSLSQWKE